MTTKKNIVLPSMASPVEVGSLRIPNRFTMASLTRNRSVPSNVPNDANELYYEQRAHGGTGLILSEGTLVYQQGTEWPNAPGIWNDEQVAAWKRVTDRVHRQGGHIFCQLWSVGRVAHPDMPEQKAAGEPVWAPSAISARGGKFRTLPGEPGYVQPTAVDDPKKLIAHYVRAAENAKKAGFDGVELHGANGYLVHQFLDNTANIRTDAYGGSVENRARFAVEILTELVRIFPGRVGIKLNPCGGFNDVGMLLEETKETFSYLIKKCESLGLAYVQLVRYVSFMDESFDGKGRATQHDVWGTYSPLLKNTKIFVNGDIDAQEGEKLVKDGKVHAVVQGRPYIHNPDFTKRALTGTPLNPDSDPKTWYVAPGGNPHAAYTDYPFAAELAN